MSDLTPEPDRQSITNAHIQALYERTARIEKAVMTMAWWLVQAQTGFGQKDAQGIEAIIRASSGGETR